MGYLLFLLRRVLLVPVLLLPLAGCIDEYEPAVISASVNYLVVEGGINSAGVTTIRLSRTQNLSSTTAPPVETKAAMYIEADGGPRYNLSERKSGIYTSDSLNLDASKRYRVSFKTNDQKEYASDYVEVKKTPPIDSITWEADLERGLQIYVNTHDATNNTRYYRWEFEETWQFTAAFFIYLEQRNNRIQDRLDDIYNCWGNEKSSAITLNSTAKLGQDVVANYPLVSLPSGSPKLRIRYSVLVRQFAVTPEEFAYWELLQKNTENIGTLFDPLPSQLTGNVHCLSAPNDVVIGFVGAQSITSKRIFIGNEELPRWRSETGYEMCTLVDSVKPENVLAYFRSGAYLPIASIGKGEFLGGYTSTSADCGDCRKRGTNVRPSFWR